MADIIHRIGLKAPLSTVYDAIATVDGIAGWWTEDTSGESRVGGRVVAVFRDDRGEIGRMELEIVRLSPETGIEWRFTSGPPEWVGTHVTFALAQHGDYTVVLFGHRSWREPVEFMAHCSMKWATFLLSLRDLVETGTGKPAPRDVKIDDWN